MKVHVPTGHGVHPECHGKLGYDDYCYNLQHLKTRPSVAPVRIVRLMLTILRFNIPHIWEIGVSKLDTMRFLDNCAILAYRIVEESRLMVGRQTWQVRNQRIHAPTFTTIAEKHAKYRFWDHHQLVILVWLRWPTIRYRYIPTTAMIRYRAAYGMDWITHRRFSLRSIWRRPSFAWAVFHSNIMTCHSYLVFQSESYVIK